MKISKKNLMVALAGAFALAGSVAAGVRAQDEEPVDGPGKTDLVNACGACHTTGVITASHRTPAEWDDVISRMSGIGATLSNDEYKSVTKYLNTYYGKADSSAPATPAPAAK
jgi:cytochrome c553